MDIESGMYLYPWEIDDIAFFKKDYSATGCTAMAPALSYHQGDVLSAHTGHFRPINEAALNFSPRDELYGRIKPKVFQEVAQASTVKVLRDWCIKTGRRFSGWTVLFHNASQGGEYPELCMENLFGDHYKHSLCPSHPDVREYTNALLADICEQFSPDSILLESVNPRPAGTGPFGVIANVHITAAVRWLWSLCFCPACMDRTTALLPGLDPPMLREKAKKLALKLINGRFNINGNEDALVLMLMLEMPDLLQYQYARQLLQGEFIKEISGQMREARVELRIIPSAVPFDINKVYIEGLSFSVVAGQVDRWMPLVYGISETYGLVRNTIRLFDPQTPVGMAATLLRYPDQDAFCSTILTAKSEGCDTFYIYNYSLASVEGLSWTAKLNKMLLI